MEWGLYADAVGSNACTSELCRRRICSIATALAPYQRAYPRLLSKRYCAPTARIAKSNSGAMSTGESVGRWRNGRCS